MRRRLRFPYLLVICIYCAEPRERTTLAFRVLKTSGNDEQLSLAVLRVPPTPPPTRPLSCNSSVPPEMRRARGTRLLSRSPVTPSAPTNVNVSLSVSTSRPSTVSTRKTVKEERNPRHFLRHGAFPCTLLPFMCTPHYSASSRMSCGRLISYLFSSCGIEEAVSFLEA